MNIFAFSLYVAIWGLSLSSILIAIRFIKGPTLPDRILALDLMSANLIGIIITYATINQNTILMDVAIILSLIAFLGTMSFAYYLIHKI
ncbi:monovalent cation/H+ antiporter complex subunit F [Catalinimonas niigatensis]|uniref:monovalent cation/H+ antiporter complex subunit F n=1 Tax=Catalinimonas niigatensis TaxID=1397264 RepID=UPI0026660F34|nr:monovalent cation/H+ antiporter complex subunit F [Catalinimonas niigatensis]WPP52159.1 monovalent cation/H+ antiporter complex subunit F [Catalinimonas niigatensis]